MLRRSTVIFIAIIAILLLTNAICATPAWSSDGHSEATLGKDYKTFQSSSQPSGNAPPPINPSGVITLQQALSLGLMQNPELASFSWEMRSAEARTLQAGLLPNPEISAEVENIGGARELKGFNGAENTIQINQLFELGGKRSKRKKLAEI
jgi:outer membrane protein TolC